MQVAGEFLHTLVPPVLAIRIPAQTSSCFTEVYFKDNFMFRLGITKTGRQLITLRDQAENPDIRPQ